MEMIFYALIGLVFLYIFGKIIKIPLKILYALMKNAIIGFVFIIFANFIAGIFNITAIEITPLNAVLTGIFGLPWIILLFFIQ